MEPAPRNPGGPVLFYAGPRTTITMPTRAHRHQTPARSAAAPGLYRPSFEHDSCGVGFVATLDRMPSRKVVSLGLSALARLIHRGAVGADARTGDGAG
ncbi:MAG: hypothetical protein HKL89_02555, partial [Candidatus Dormibacteraeota bacterium]|nr:hypothetical protein [Candidatus Dormibacteraeota bacterium]